MSGLGAKLRGLLGRGPAAPDGPVVKVHVLIKGRIGEGWYDVDETVTLAQGTTLEELIAQGPRLKLPLAEALEHSPHLKHTLMWNGDRAPVTEHGGRCLKDGDRLYLLAPLAGG